MLEFLVKRLGRNHVVILADRMHDNLAGLVERIRNPAHSLPNRSSPPSVVIVSRVFGAGQTNLDECRSMGAVCLERNTIDTRVLEQVNAKHASAIVILGEDDRENARVLNDVYHQLQQDKPKQVPDTNPLRANDSGDVSCMVQVNQPELVEVLRRHEYHGNTIDRLRLQIFSRHEMTARAMLRETGLPALNKIMILGLGAEGRLVDSLVSRAIKDQKIEHPDSPAITIHVVDDHASAWANVLHRTKPFSQQDVWDHAIPRTATKCGFGHVDGQYHGLHEEKYDAIFVCLQSESLAVSQAVRISDELAKYPEIANTPIVVAVQDESAGFGAMLKMKGSGGLGPNIKPVGTQSRVFDVIESRHPVAELVAQVLHQDYLTLHQKRIDQTTDAEQRAKLIAKPANKPWPELDEKFKESNRQLAYRLGGMFEIPAPPPASANTISKRFQMIFAPFELIDPTGPYGFDLNDSAQAASLERLAEVEHNNWVAAMAKLGWQYGDPNEQTPPPGVTYNLNMVPWDKLDDGTKEYDRNIIKRLPYVLAKADYKLVEVA